MKDDEFKSNRQGTREDGFDEEGSFFQRVRADVFRKKVEGVLKDGVIKNLVSELKLPREIVTHIMSQIDETKQATLKLVGKEVRQFFENTNLAEEMANLLSQLSFEVSTKVRFVRNDPPPKKPSRVKLSRETKVKMSQSEPDDDAPRPADDEDGKEDAQSEDAR
jgi:hypothetical protein